MKILGFDLGDGESAVALLDGESTVEPRMMPLAGRTSMLSSVGRRGGRIVVGDEASVMSGAQDVKVRFKSRYLTDPAASQDVRMFAQGVFAALSEAEPGLMAQVSRTVVGCPAGWGEGRREQYAALMESAGFPNVSVVPEPRAAFLYARHARGLRVDAGLMRQSAMVIDIGSSTTDFAYIVDGHQQNLSMFGDTNLGGGLLDEVILARAIERSPDKKALEGTMQASPAWRSYCELAARRLKEKYFTDEEKWQEKPITSTVTVCYDETLLLELSLSGKEVAQIIRTPLESLGGRSFVQTTAQALEAARTVSRDCPPQVVILTGGASRMAFFRQACRDAFPDAVLVLCPEPECSIARGLAYAGRVDERLRTFREEVASLARGERLAAAVNASVHELYEPLAEAVFDIAKACTLDAARLWRRGGIATVDDMDAQIQERIAAALSGDALKERAQEPLERWTRALLSRIEGELAALCERCGVPQEKMTLKGASVHTGVKEVKVKLTDAMGMDVLSKVMGVVLAVVGGTVCSGSGMAFIAAGPMGAVVGVLAGIVVAQAGKAGMESMMRSAKLPRLVRMAVTDGAIERGLRRQKETICRGVITALSMPENGFAAGLTESVAATLGSQLEEMARDAEMSVEA